MDFSPGPAPPFRGGGEDLALDGAVLTHALYPKIVSALLSCRMVRQQCSMPPSRMRAQRHGLTQHLHVQALLGEAQPEAAAELRARASAAMEARQAALKSMPRALGPSDDDPGLTSYLEQNLAVMCRFKAELANVMRVNVVLMEGREG
jgi:hypothetical protein